MNRKSRFRIFIIASALVAGRAFSFRGGIRLHSCARPPHFLNMRSCDYASTSREIGNHTPNGLDLFYFSNRYSFLAAVTAAYRGGSLGKGICSTRITVTLSIFNFSTRFFAQIVENRETQLSSLFLGPGDIFSKSYDENRFVWQLYGN